MPLIASSLLSLTAAVASPPAAAASLGPAKPERAPAVAKTDLTVANVAAGDDSDLGKSNYKIGKGLTLSSKNGRFSLQIRGRIQLRYDAQHYNRGGEAARPTDHSLQIRRLRLQLRGHVFSPFVKYYFQFGFSPADMQNDMPDEPGSIRRNPLRDARIELDRLRDFTVWMGQFKVPFSRQRVNSSSAQNLVDRSIVNSEFNLSRDLGVMVGSKDLGGLDGRLAYSAGVFMGEGRNTFELTDPGLLYVGRLELLPFGKFDDYSEGDLTRSPTPGLSIAAAYAFQDRAHAARGVVGDPPADRGTTNFHHVTSDILFKWHGASLAAAFHLRRGFARRPGDATDEAGDPIAPVAARQGIGVLTQLGYLVPKIPLEIVARHAIVRNIYGAESSMLDADEAGGGLNYYFVGHDLKLQLDYFRLWDASLGDTTAEAARNGTDRVRVQVQLYF